MNLEQVLAEPGFVGLSDADALDYGNQSVTIREDSTAYTWSGLGERLIANGVSPTDFVSFASNIGSLPGGAVLDKCLSSGGFNFADSTNRALIQSFEINEPDWAVTLLNAMLAVGVVTGTRWQLYDVAQPTVEDITMAREHAANQAAVTLFCTTVWNPLIGTGQATPADLKTAVENWTP